MKQQSSSPPPVPRCITGEYVCVLAYVKEKREVEEGVSEMDGGRSTRVSTHACSMHAYIFAIEGCHTQLKPHLKLLALQESAAVRVNLCVCAGREPEGEGEGVSP